MIGSCHSGSGLLLQSRDVRLEPVEPVVPLRSEVLEIVVRVLERCGAQCPGSELRIAPLKDANHYLELFRAQWDDRLDRLEAYVARLQRKS